MSYSLLVASRTKVLLIGIDGLILNRALASGRATTLAALRSDCYFSEMLIDMPTISGPSWTTLLTGVSQGVHKVIDNEYRDHNLAMVPDLLTQAAAYLPELSTYAAAGWPPLIDPAGVGPVIATRLEDQRLGKHKIFVRDGETYGYELIDAEVANDAKISIQETGPDVSFIYFCGADEAGHLHGTIEGPYVDAIERIDGYVSQLHQVILTRQIQLQEKWLIIITTDHGHLDEGGHGGDSAQERASFVIAHGIGTAHPSWPTDIKPEELVNEILGAL